MIDKNWMPLQSIPASGKTLLLDDQEFWQSAFTECALDCRILESLTARVAILPQQEGVLFRGQIHGRVILPCDRCANDSTATLAHSFDSFEPLPADALPIGHAAGSEEEDVESADEAVIRIAANGRGVEINPSALAWQEFCLALPVKPLCDEQCKGLCPVCGVNRNTGHCSCGKVEGDPRLAALRGLTVRSKK